MADRESSNKPLLRWFAQNGGTLHSCSVLVDPKVGTKVMATGAVPAGDPLISVPQSLCLSFESAKEHGFGDIIKDYPQLEQAPDEILAAHLCAERLKGSSSKWGPYVSALPREVDSPIFWDDEALSLLEGTTLHLMVAEMKKGLRRDYDNIHAPLAEQYPDVLRGVTFDDYCWAMSMLFSRAFSIDGKKYLVPVIDSFNHQPNVVPSIEDVIHVDEPNAAATAAAAAAAAAGEEAPELCWRFRAAEAYDLGDECLGLYGNYCNAKLLYSYGFTLREEAAAQAAVDFWVKCRNNDPAIGAKREILARCPLAAKLYTYGFEGTLKLGQISPQLLWVARIVSLAPEDMGHAGKAFTGMVNPVNERKAYEALRASLVAKLAQLDSTAARAERSVDELTVAVDEMMLEQHPVQAIGSLGAVLVAPEPTAKELEFKTTLRQYNAAIVLEEETLVVRSCVQLLESWMEQMDEEGAENFVPVDVGGAPEAPGGTSEEKE